MGTSGVRGVGVSFINPVTLNKGERKKHMRGTQCEDAAEQKEVKGDRKYLGNCSQMAALKGT